MNRTETYEKKKESRDRLKSGFLTAAIWSGLLLFLFIYKIVERIPAKKEVETRMLINFGDNRNGNGAEEPENQEGSVATESPVKEDPVPNPEPETSSQENVKVPVKAEKQTAGEHILTGKDDKKKVAEVDHSEKKSEKTSVKPKTSGKQSNSGAKKSAGTPDKSPNPKISAGDGKGAAAIGSLLKGRGSKSGSQGTGGEAGNAGDPLGGAGDGDSKIGIDRKLVGYIPGTMGRGGSQPAHSCTAEGSITISYTVDKAGNVVSARRSSGLSDPCVVTTSVSWVKRYVKAERANSSSTGTYRITF